MNGGLYRRRWETHANAQVRPRYRRGLSLVARTGEEPGVRAWWSAPVADGSLLLGSLTTYRPSPRGRRSCDRVRTAARPRTSPIQRDVQPAVPRQIGSVELASHYRPGDRTAEVGGDWFDAVPVGDGLVLVMGDVEGHDSRAAALMAELSAATRAAARHDEHPAAVLARASDRLDQLGCDLFATVLVVHIDLRTRVATAASAGHLAPALLTPTPTGAVQSPMALETGPPLGIGQDWDERSTLLPADAVLLLYTDGLVEDRAHDIDEKIRRLGELAETSPLDAASVLDSALELQPVEGQDDVSILVAHVP